MAIEGERIRAAAEARKSEMVAFAQNLIQTPSLPGDERAIAALVEQRLKQLGYDDVWIDRVGNVIGAIRGEGGKTVQFNTHLDHVAPGDLALWPYPPYEARIVDDVLYGRAACDVKGAMATQVYAGALLRDLGLRPPGDIFFAGVVLEEVGGFGSQTLAQEMPTDIAVLGEASENQLRRGHRGRVYLRVVFLGTSAHASAPDRAANPHFAAARFLLALESIQTARNPTFGQSTVAPTLIATDQTSGNVTPAELTLFIDWRNVPGETAEEAQAAIGRLADEAANQVTGVSAETTIVGRDVRSYTGLEASMPPTRSYELAHDHPVLLTARRVLSSVLDRPVTTGTWGFGTDGGHLAFRGITTIGFAPGAERHAHTIWDQVGIPDLLEALSGNAALAMTLGKDVASDGFSQ